MKITYRTEQPRKDMTYIIQTRVLETVVGFSGEWFVDVRYLSDEQLVVRHIIYGPCNTLIMAVLTEDEIRRSHVVMISELLEHIHTINFG